MRCLAGAPVRRSGGITAAQWFGSGTEGAGVALGCRGGGGVARVGLQGVRVPIKAGPSILACVPGAGVAQRSRASRRRKRITATAVVRSRGSGGESSGRRACAGGWPVGPVELGWSTGQRAAGRGAAERSRGAGVTAGKKELQGGVSLSAREATCVRTERGDGERVCAVTGRAGRRGVAGAELGHAGGKGGGTAWAVRSLGWAGLG